MTSSFCPEHSCTRDDCPGLWAAEHHRQARLARDRMAAGQAWADLRAAMGSEMFTVGLSRASVAPALAAAFRDHGTAIRDEMRADMAPDLRHHEWVRRLQGWAVDYGSDEYASALTPADLARADLTEQILVLVGEAVELAAGEDAVLRLTAAPQRPTQEQRPKTTPWQVMHPTLAHGPTRGRLRLAGHPSSRNAAGYGRLFRGQDGPEAAETATGPDGAANGMAPGRQAPEMAVSAPGRRRMRRSRRRR